MKKKITSLFLMAFLLIGTLGFVIAAEEEDLIPEAKRVGFFEDRFDRIRLAFTFNKEKKIGKTLEMAEKRLIEAGLLSVEDPEDYERTQERYDELIAKAEDILSEIETDVDDAEESEENIKRIARIQDKFERHRDHSDEIYSRALERFTTNNASSEKIQRFEMFHERAISRSDKLEERALERRENAVRKHKALSEMTDEELEGLLNRIEEDEGLKEGREKRFEKAEKRIEKFEEIGARRIDRAFERLESTEGLTEKERARVQERIGKFEGRIGEIVDRAGGRLDLDRERTERLADDFRGRIGDELDLRQRDNSDNDDQIVCTMEVKECSDGTFVGRVAPDCKFAPCSDDSVLSSDIGQIACTMEVKECSDGTFVGRVAPDCEFAPCSDDSVLSSDIA